MFVLATCFFSFYGAIILFLWFRVSRALGPAQGATFHHDAMSRQLVIFLSPHPTTTSTVASFSACARVLRMRTNGVLNHRGGTYGDSRGDSHGGPGVTQDGIWSTE